MTDIKTSRRLPRKSQNRISSHIAPGEGWIPLQQAVEVLRQYDVPGYGNRESARQRIIVENALPHKTIGKRHYVAMEALDTLIGAQPAATSDSSSEDQRLVRYFLEDPARDAVSAVADGIARSLGHARSVWAEFRTSPTAAAAIDAALAKKREQERLAREAAERAWRCPECQRGDQVAREEHARVAREVAPEGDGGLTIVEERALATFGSYRCNGCVRWRADAPTAAMREHLQQWRAAQEAAAPAERESTHSQQNVPAQVAGDGGGDVGDAAADGGVRKSD